MARAVRSAGGDLPVDRRNAGHVVLGANAFGQQPVPDLPGEHGGIFSLVIRYGIDDGRGGHFGFAAADHAGFEAARLVVSGKKKETLIDFTRTVYRP